MMSKAQAQRMQKQQEWREHLRRQEVSGQTIADYAKSAGISTDALYYWRGRFAREARLKAAPATFTPVRVVSAPSAAASVRLHLRNGVVVEWSQACDAEALEQVLRLAGGLP